MVEFDTTGFNRLLLKENLVDEPGAGKRRRVRTVVLTILVILGVMVVALAVGIVLGSALSYYDYQQSLEEVSQWRAE